MAQVLLNCDFCKAAFYRSMSYYNFSIKKGYKTNFCSKKCQGKHQTLINSIEIECPTCQNKCRKTGRDYKKSNIWFCSNRCHTIYKNNNKTYGTRRSWLERYLEKQLTILFPNLKMEFNNKKIIGFELDIYFPELKLAIELNGIFHYQSIYGEDKLKLIQKNDFLKKEACFKELITLVIIDTTKQKRFNKQTSQSYLDTICEILNSFVFLSN